MKKLVSGLLIFVGFLSLIGKAQDQKNIVRHLPAADFQREKLERLPAYDPKAEKNWQVDLRGYNLSALNLKDRLNDLMMSSFDSKTKWPKDLPTSFDPNHIMELSKNPGLGIKSLHKKGITGKGVSIGIIDQGLLIDHIEYKDRLRLYEEIHCRDEQAAMHGSALASISVGKTVGVAPEADLYYIGSTFFDRVERRSDIEVDFKYVAQCIDRILEINKSLPKEKKIRVVAVAIGWANLDRKNAVMANDAVGRAKKEGVLVVTSSFPETHGLRFHGLNRNPLADPEKPTSYTLGSFLLWNNGLDEIIKKDNHQLLLIPMDSRCTASPTGNSDYVFYREGGWSWVIPYVAGLYALACQVKTDITPEAFWNEALDSGDALEIERNNQKYCLGKIVNPEKLIGRLQNLNNQVMQFNE